MPAVEAAQAYGVRVHVWGVEPPYGVNQAERLVWEADTVDQLDAEFCRPYVEVEPAAVEEAVEPRAAGGRSRRCPTPAEVFAARKLQAPMPKPVAAAPVPSDRPGPERPEMEQIGARIAARWLLTRGRENIADLLPGPVLPTVIDKELLVEAEEEISRSLRPYEEARRALRDGFWAKLHKEFGIQLASVPPHPTADHHQPVTPPSGHPAGSAQPPAAHSSPAAPVHSGPAAQAHPSSATQAYSGAPGQSGPAAPAQSGPAAQAHPGPVAPAHPGPAGPAHPGHRGPGTNPLRSGRPGTARPACSDPRRPGGPAASGPGRPGAAVRPRRPGRSRARRPGRSRGSAAGPQSGSAAPTQSGAAASAAAAAAAHQSAGQPEPASLAAAGGADPKPAAAGQPAHSAGGSDPAANGPAQAPAGAVSTADAPAPHRDANSTPART